MTFGVPPSRMTHRICIECGWKTLPASHPRTPGTRKYRARGLCDNCYKRAQTASTVIDYERSTWPMELMLEEYERVGGHRLTFAQAAERIGVTRDALERAVGRAKQKGLAA